MIKIRQITEDEMISIFLDGELLSRRFGRCTERFLKEKDLDRKIVTDPNLKNEKENSCRKSILKDCRDFGAQEGLFGGFPEEVDWYDCTLAPKEVEEIKYIDYDYWIELSGGSRLAKDAAKQISKGVEIFGQSNKQFLEAAEALKKGASFPKMILVARDEVSPLVVLEGHLRLTAYMLAPKYIPERLKVIVGYSKDMDKWGNYGES